MICCKEKKKKKKQTQNSLQVEPQQKQNQNKISSPVQAGVFSSSIYTRFHLLFHLFSHFKH